MYYPNKKYVVFDFETTGFDPLKDDVLQISAIKFDGENKQVFNAFVKTDKEISKKIQDLTSITPALIKEKGIDKEKAWKEFAEFIDRHPLIGHNSIAFDKQFLEKNFNDLGLKLPDTRAYIDTAMLYKAKKIGEVQKWYESHYDFCCRLKNIVAYGKYNLSLCCQELEIDVTQFTAHQSDSDVEMTNLVYQRFVLNK